MNSISGVTTPARAKCIWVTIPLPRRTLRRGGMGRFGSL